MRERHVGGKGVGGLNSLTRQSFLHIRVFSDPALQYIIIIYLKHRCISDLKKRHFNYNDKIIHILIYFFNCFKAI